MENKQCLKCRSINAPDATYCRFCHGRFTRLKTFIEKTVPPLPPRMRFSRRMIVAAGTLLAITAGFIFRRRTINQKEKPQTMLD